MTTDGKKKYYFGNDKIKYSKTFIPKDIKQTQ